VASIKALLISGAVPFLVVLASAGPVELARIPDEGIQPQVVVDSKGEAHLLFLKGNPQSADVYYARLDRSGQPASPVIRVNHFPGSAIAIGTIRGPQMALGKNDRVHVVWNGSNHAPPAPHKGPPLLYTRFDATGSKFEIEKDVITEAAGLDGGSSVAADPDGTVYVVWHAHQSGKAENEAGRAVFVARSNDEGAHFAKEKRADTQGAGVCGCCGLRAFASRGGFVSILYRQAVDIIRRDERWLVSRDGAKTFRSVLNHPWETGACPMSSASFAETGRYVLGAWESHDQIYFASLDRSSLNTTVPIAAPGASDKRKHPALAINQKGDVLLAWTEGTGWQKGGAVAWQVFDQNGQPTAEHGRKEGVPVWSLVAAYANPAGDFVILY